MRNDVVSFGYQICRPHRSNPTNRFGSLVHGAYFHSTSVGGVVYVREVENALLFLLVRKKIIYLVPFVRQAFHGFPTPPSKYPINSVSLCFFNLKNGCVKLCSGKQHRPSNPSFLEFKRERHLLF